MRSMRWALTGVVLVLVSCGGGSLSSNSEVSSTASEELTTQTDAFAEVVYKVGDTGPGGGIIVYVDEEGFRRSDIGQWSIGAMCKTGTCHYLEMAQADVGGTSSYGNAIAAAEYYSTATADDWVLPTRDALNEVCKYAFGDTVNAICNDSGGGPFSNSVGGFLTNESPSTLYWSSSNAVAGADPQFWLQSFKSGEQLQSGKLFPGYVRPVRAF